MGVRSTRHQPGELPVPFVHYQLHGGRKVSGLGSRTFGLAVAMPSSNFPGLKVSGIFSSDYGWRNRSFHLAAEEALDGIQSKAFVWYILPGFLGERAEVRPPVPSLGSQGS